VGWLGRPGRKGHHLGSVKANATARRRMCCSCTAATSSRMSSALAALWLGWDLQGCHPGREGTATVALLRLRWWPALPPPRTCPTRFASSRPSLRNVLRSPKNHSSRERPKQGHKRRLHADYLVRFEANENLKRRSSLCAGFERAGCWGPPWRWSGTARLHRGMSLAQTPPGLPLTRRSPRRGSLVGGSRRESACSS
jgi:hypothetical protein